MSSTSLVSRRAGVQAAGAARAKGARLVPRPAATQPRHSLSGLRLRDVGSMRVRSVGGDKEPEAAPAVVALVEEEDRFFLEPAVRAFALGIGAGVLFELGHVLSQMPNVAALVAGESLALPGAEALAPLVAWDNIAAIVACAAFYGIEVSSILPVLRKYKDSKEAARVLNRLPPTLPKVLMPLDLLSVKRAIIALMAVRNPATALGANASAFVDSNRSGGGTAVLDRPAPPPPIGAPGSQLPRFPGGDERLTAGSGAVTAPTKPRAPPPPPPPMKRTGRSPSPAPSTPRAGKRSAGLAPGAWDPAQALPETRRAKELRERRAFLKNFWYVAALSSSLRDDKPLEVQILGRTVSLFRDETGKVRCIDNVCPHRGAPLGQGWTKDVDGHTCVVCPYHGWAFNGEGRLTEVPSSADQRKLPKRPLVDAYPVVEQQGFIWLFFGSSAMPAEERPPIPSCKELDNPAWQPVYGELEFDSAHWSVFDNALDFAHIHYIHNDSFGNSDKPVLNMGQLTRDTWGIHGNFNIHNKPVNALWEWTAVDTVPVEYAAFLPSTSCIKITLGAGVQMITFVNTTPIDANRSINRFCLIRNFAAWEGFDVWARNAMFKILGEDKVILETLKPEAIRTEVSLEADQAQIAFRRLRQEWVDMGYCVDPEVTSSSHGTLDM